MTTIETMVFDDSIPALVEVGKFYQGVRVVSVGNGYHVTGDAEYSDRAVEFQRGKQTWGMRQSDFIKKYGSIPDKP